MPDFEKSSVDKKSDERNLFYDAMEMDINALLQQLTGESSCPGNHALSNYLENAPDPVLLFDDKSEVIAKNRRALEFWDGKNDFIPAQLINAVSKVDRSGAPFHEDKKNRLIAIDSRMGRRYFLPSIFHLIEPSKIHADASFKSVIVCVLKDETVWERSERLRTSLFSSISHELNTPLTSARLVLYLLAEQQIGTLNDKQLEMVESAKQDLDREIITIQNVINMIRNEGSDHSDAETEEINLHRLVEETISEFEGQIASMHLSIKRTYSNASPRVAMARETAELVIHQLFASLIKYSSEGTDIEVATNNRDGHCTLELRTQNGELEDFPPDDLFSMAMESARTRQLRCADLGLRVAHEMVSPYGGSLGSERSSESAKLLFHFPLLKG